MNIVAAMLEAAAMMTPLATILAVCGLGAFLLACLAFVGTIWKISWSLRGWVSSQQVHVENQGKLVGLLGEYIDTQKEANRHLQASVELLSQRLDRFDAEREDVHRAVRAMNRKLNYIEGEDVKVEQRPA